MTQVCVAQHLAHSTDLVWAMIGDFGGLHRWHPQVRAVDLSWEGRIRTVHYADGRRGVERLEARSDAFRRCVYVVVDGTLPVDDCRVTLHVTENDNGSTVKWSCEFEPLGNGESNAIEQLHSYYREGLLALVSALDG